MGLSLFFLMLMMMGIHDGAGKLQESAQPMSMFSTFLGLLNTCRGFLKYVPSCPPSSFFLPPSRHPRVEFEVDATCNDINRGTSRVVIA